MHLLAVVAVLATYPSVSHAGFDFGEPWNALFWVVLSLWSAGLSAVIFIFRKELGARVVRVLRVFFAPNTKKQRFVVSHPKFRPMPEVVSFANRVETSVNSFLKEQTHGIQVPALDSDGILETLHEDAQPHVEAVSAQKVQSDEHQSHVQKEVHAVLAVDEKRTTQTTPAALHLQRVRRKKTSLRDRARNIRALIMPQQKKVPQVALPQRIDIPHIVPEQHSHERVEEKVQPNAVLNEPPLMPITTYPDDDREFVNRKMSAHVPVDAAHARAKIQILANAQRAMLRARNAQEGLPLTQDTHYESHLEENVSMPAPEVRAQVKPTQVVIQHKEKMTPLTIHSKRAVQPTPLSSTPKQVQKSATLHNEARAQAVPPVAKKSGPMKDELVLETSQGIPRLVLTRRHAAEH